MLGGSSSAVDTKNATFDFVSPGRFDLANSVAASGCSCGPRPGPPGPLAGPPPPSTPRPPGAGVAPGRGWHCGIGTCAEVTGRILNPGPDIKTTPLSPTPL